MICTIMNPQTKENISTESLMKYPLGQRLLRAGFKAVTQKQLEERFCCAQIMKNINEGNWESILKKTEIKKKELEKDDYEILGIKEYPNGDPETMNQGLWGGKDWSIIPHIEILHKSKEGCERKFAVQADKPHKLCVVKSENAETYIGDLMPDHVVDTMNACKEIGVNKFEVCYPAIEDVPQKDPVLVAMFEQKDSKGNIFNTQWIELSMWE